MVKVYIPRRLIERNRWLRSDGKPNFKDRLSSRPQELELVANKNVPLLSMQATIINTCEVMSLTGSRLIPIVDPDRRLLGVVAGMDLVDYFGGGLKHTIILKHYKNNIYSALSAPLRDIANTKPIAIDVRSGLQDLLNLMVTYGIGAIPVVDNGIVIGIITEGELIKYLASKVVGVKVREVMTTNIISLDHGSTLGTAMKLMVNLGIRRLPITMNGDIVGIVTWKDIVDLFGKHKIFSMLKNYTFDEVHSLPVTNVMGTEVKTIDLNSDLGEAAAKMMELGVDSLLVTSDDRVIGIITERDILYGIVAR